MPKELTLQWSHCYPSAPLYVYPRRCLPCSIPLPCPLRHYEPPVRLGFYQAWHPPQLPFAWPSSETGT